MHVAITGSRGEPAALIQVEAVERRYGSGCAACLALRNITLHIHPGEFVAVVGPSGSGKSTLLNIMGGIDRPTAGVVRIDDRDLARLSEIEGSDTRLHRFGFVFQDARLVPVLTVRENIEFPLLFRRDLKRTHRNERIAAILEEVNLTPLQHRRPGELSAGEQQRAALARAFAGNPAIVLADEPTSNLDRATGTAMIALMRSISRQRGTTIVCATHDAQLVMTADRIVRLRDGNIE